MVAKQKLHVALVQMDIVWENIEANLAWLDEQMGAIGSKADIIVLPEMFSTGFSMKSSDLAEPMKGTTAACMNKWAHEQNALIIGSTIIFDRGQYYNRLLAVLPTGATHAYDKRHLFGLAAETRHYDNGEDRLVFQYRGWNICPLICYDLRFPVWSRNDVGYDLLVYVANWPSKRAFAWNRLLCARAIENQVYTIGVNRIGSDASGQQYQGDSQILDCTGRQLLDCKDDIGIHFHEIDYDDQAKFRQNFPFLKDRDMFEIHLNP